MLNPLLLALSIVFPVPVLVPLGQAPPPPVVVDFAVVPVSTGPTDAVLGRGPRVGFWNIRACQDGTLPLLMPRERFYLAAGHIPFLTAPQLRAIAEAKKRTRRREVITQALTYAGLGLSVAQRQYVWAALAGPGVSLFLDAVKRGEIDPAPLLAEAEKDVFLGPAGCASFSAVATRIKNASPHRGRIELPPQAVAVGSRGAEGGER